MSTIIDRLDGLSSTTAYKGPARLASPVHVNPNGLKVVDGVQTVAKDRVILTNQNDKRQNGLWIVDTGNWRRAADFNKTGDVAKGTRVWATEGNSGPAELEVTTANPVRIGTDLITFELSAGTANAAGLSQAVRDAEAILVSTVNAGTQAVASINVAIAAGTVSIEAARVGAVTSVNTQLVNAQSAIALAGAAQLSALYVAGQVGLAAVETAKGYAQDAAAVSAVFVPVFASRQTAAGANILPFINTIQTLCHTIPAGGGGARYARRVGPGSLAFGFRSNDRYLPNGTVDATNGGYWEIIEEQLDARMAGVIFDYDPVTKVGTDNFQALTRLWQNSLPSVSTEAQFLDTPPVAFPRGRAFVSDTINIKKWIKWVGCHQSQMTATGTDLWFPKGKSGIVFHAPATKGAKPVLDSPATTGAAGSILEGIRCVAQDVTLTGTVTDYNPAIGRMLAYSWTATPANGQALEFYSPHDAVPVVAGSATVSGVGEVAARVLCVRDPLGQFVVGESVLIGGITVGVVIYLNSAQTGIVIRNVAGANPVAGQTLTGGNSAATATIVTFTNSGTTVKAIPVASVSGNIDITTGTDKATIWREAGVSGTGILATTTVSLINSGATQFAEHGVVMYASVPGAGGNANRWKIAGLSVFRNGGNGLILSGGDVNAFDSSGVDARLNTGYAVNDVSFLGGKHAAYHASNNLLGEFCSINTINRQSTWDTEYSESQAVLQPFRSLKTVIDFPNVIIGGPHGIPVMNSPGKQPATRLSSVSIQSNGFDYLNGGSQARDGQLAITNISASLAIPLVLENINPPSAGRGVGVQFLGPNGTTSSLYGQIDTNIGVGDLTYISLKAPSRFTGSPVVTAQGTTGEGFVGYAVVSGGVFTGVIVCKPGRNYSADTVLTVTGGAGTGASLRPNMLGGRINSVTIVAGGTGYNDQSLVEALRVSSKSVSMFPAASVTPTVNGEVTFQLTSNTQLTFKVKGSDGVVRSASVTLS